MSTNTAGDGITTCPHCGETYYFINGHNCPNVKVAYFEKSSYTVVTPTEEKLDKIIELLEKVLRRLN